MEIYPHDLICKLSTKTKKKGGTSFPKSFQILLDPPLYSVVRENVRLMFIFLYLISFDGGANCLFIELIITSFVIGSFCSSTLNEVAFLKVYHNLLDSVGEELALLLLTKDISLVSN